MSAPRNWEECAEAGITLTEAARLLGKSPSTGRSYAKLHNVKFRKITDRVSDQEARLRELFDRGASWANIAENLGVGVDAVMWRARKLGLRHEKTARAANPTLKTVWNRKYKATHPEKHRAHARVTAAKQRKRLIAQPCEKCGAEQTQAHHDDYSKPLDVRWLCQTCHAAEHRAASGGGCSSPAPAVSHPARAG